jgi:hypothetical protein
MIWLQVLHNQEARQKYISHKSLRTSVWCPIKLKSRIHLCFDSVSGLIMQSLLAVFLQLMRIWHRRQWDQSDVWFLQNSHGHQTVRYRKNPLCLLLDDRFVSRLNRLGFTLGSVTFKRSCQNKNTQVYTYKWNKMIWKLNYDKLSFKFDTLEFCNGN